jgi:hypothetical protein
VEVGHRRVRRGRVGRSGCSRSLARGKVARPPPVVTRAPGMGRLRDAGPAGSMPTLHVHPFPSRARSMA